MFEQNFNQLCSIILILTTLGYCIKMFWPNIEYINTFILIGLRTSFICLTISLLQRWIISSHIPLSNLYESSIFLAWSLLTVYIILKRKISYDWMGMIVMPSTLLIQVFATFVLPKEMQQVSVLVPALQSNWLMMHVSMMILSYGFLLIGSLLSVSFLILYYQIMFPTYSYNNDLLLESNKQNSLENFFLTARKNCMMDQLDYWSYRSIGIGFALLTIGIVSGAVWANDAWGSYWSWDPKETWALITWMIFAIYLHSRMIIGWSGKNPAFVASFGLFIVWACYLGVNLLGKGLHSYGWLSSV